jgi:hypothetical protein
MDTPEPEPKRFQRGPCIVKFEGLYAMLKSKKHPSSTKRGMLVSHDFVDLYKSITIDHKFDHDTFNRVAENERDFMKYALKKCQIDSREFDSAYNKIIHPLVDRLHMVEAAIKTGDDSPILKKEYLAILTELYDKNVFSYQFYYQMKRSINRSLGPSKA